MNIVFYARPCDRSFPRGSDDSFSRSRDSPRSSTSSARIPYVRASAHAHAHACAGVVAGEHGSVNTIHGESELTPWLLTFPEVESELNDCRSSFYDS